jgi:hypothetical protein
MVGGKEPGKKVAARNSYTLEKKDEVVNAFLQREDKTQSAEQFIEEFNKDIPPSSFRKWLKGYPFMKGQPEQRKRKLFTRDNSCLSLLEEVMVVFMERSNAKRGTSDVLWNQHALLSLAMSLRASLDKLTVGSLDEVKRQLPSTTFRARNPEVSQSFASVFYKRHEALCVRVKPCQSRAVEITAEIKKNPLFSNDMVEVQHVSGKGYGLFSLKSYVVGEVITRYEGVHIAYEETQHILYDSTYVWTTDEYNVTIDAQHTYSCFGRFINDALSPLEGSDKRSDNRSDTSSDLDSYSGSDYSGDEGDNHHTNHAKPVSKPINIPISSPGVNCKICPHTEGPNTVYVVMATRPIPAGVELLRPYSKIYWQHDLAAGAIPPKLAAKVTATYGLPEPTGTSVFLHPKEFWKAKK